MKTEQEKIQESIVELTRAMKISAQREDYHSAADIQRVIGLLKEPSKRSFSESEIEQLQSKVHSITGNGEVMQLFNELLGNQVG